MTIKSVGSPDSFLLFEPCAVHSCFNVGLGKKSGLSSAKIRAGIPGIAIIPSGFPKFNFSPPFKGKVQTYDFYPLLNVTFFIQEGKVISE